MFWTALNYLLYGFIFLLDCTLRYRYVGEENLKALTPGKPMMFALWHHVLMVGIMAQKKISFAVMVSRSRDGDPVAFVCEKYGHQVVRGSSSKGTRDKGGAVALVEMIRRIKKGSPSALTVDGPTGPPRVVKEGIIKMAQKTDAAIIPYAPMFKRYWRFNSWDGFRVPKPFTQAVIYYGEAVHVNDMPVDQAIEHLGQAIDLAEAKANEFLS